MPLLRLFTEASVVYRSICCNRIVQIFAEAASAEASVKRFGRSFCRIALWLISGLGSRLCYLSRAMTISPLISSTCTVAGILVEGGDAS